MQSTLPDLVASSKHALSHQSFQNSKARIILTLLMVGLFLAASAKKQVEAQVVPGATIENSLGSSVYPVVLGYDSMASTLYTIAETGSGYVFGSIQPSTGAFTPISNLSVSFGGSSSIAVLASNKIASTSAQAIILRSDGLLRIDLSTGVSSLGPSPSPNAPSSIGFDSLTTILFGQTSVGLDALMTSSGAESSVAPYSFLAPFEAATAAVDPYRGLFYVTKGDGATLYAISETTGAVSSVQLKIPLYNLAFDVSSNAASAALYGTTQCCTTGLPKAYELVRVNTATGNETKITDVGDSKTYFLAETPNSLNGNDEFFSTTYSNDFIAVDTATDRSWYIESPIGESSATLNAWMTSAGEAMGLRDSALSSKRVANAILDFGSPSVKGAVYGARFKGMQFLSTSAIQSAVIAFANGWYAAVGDASAPSLRIVVGTTNYNKAGGVTQAHGEAWAAMMAKISTSFAQSAYASRVTAIAGMDMELAYSAPSAVSAWATGFDSSAYADYGDAPGCPAACNNGWTANLVVTLGGTSFFPEIYSAGGGNAKSWAGLSSFNYSASGVPLNIVAPLSELTACVQESNCGTTKATRIDNTPTAAWIQMVGALKAPVATSAASIAPSTNIEHRVP
jgi:hypothetical protein